MDKITNLEELRTAIEYLEQESRLQEDALKEKARGLLELFKPGNIIKSGINQFITEPGKGKQVMNSLLAIGAGILFRGFIPGKQASVLTKVVSTALQVGIANLVARKAGSWKLKAGRLFRGKKHAPSHNGEL